MSYPPNRLPDPFDRLDLLAVTALAGLLAVVMLIVALVDANVGLFLTESSSCRGHWLSSSRFGAMRKYNSPCPRSSYE